MPYKDENFSTFLFLRIVVKFILSGTFKYLKELEINKSHIKNTGIKVICKADWFYLTKLSLKEVGITPDVNKCLLKHSMPNLEVLWLYTENPYDGENFTDCRIKASEYIGSSAVPYNTRLRECKIYKRIYKLPPMHHR